MRQDFVWLFSSFSSNSFSNGLRFCPCIRSYKYLQIMQDGAAVTGLAIAGASLVAVHYTGNAIYDPIGSILVGNLLGMVKRVHKTANVPNYLVSVFV